jgi:hypothetical protein
MTTEITPGEIERQEAEGQQWFLTHQVLPKEALNDKSQLEAWGFVFGEQVDDLFVSCQYPAGWYVKGASWTPYYSGLHDVKDRIRIIIFYRAAFHNRKAQLKINPRFQIGTSEEINGYIVRDNQEKTILFEARNVPISKICAQWLEEHYPDYRNPFAYWDDTAPALAEEGREA